MGFFDMQKMDMIPLITEGLNASTNSMMEALHKCIETKNQCSILEDELKQRLYNYLKSKGWTSYEDKNLHMIIRIMTTHKKEINFRKLKSAYPFSGEVVFDTKIVEELILITDDVRKRVKKTIRGG